MRRFLWLVGVVVLWPSTAAGGSCSDFPWYVPQDMIVPSLVQEGQQAMKNGSLREAQELFARYLLEHEEGVFAKGAQWVIASLPDPSDEPGEFFKQIKRLQSMKAEHPDSLYAPWGLCSIGQLYWDAGWYSEAKSIFEEFLGAYPEHPLAGGVMVEAGLGYLKNGQFLEAALVLRRVVEEPKWEAHRSRGALGLADATAISKAWKQAHYWYRVVEAEKPELIRQSEQSSYYYGLTELAVGEPQNAISRFLTTVNLHPRQDIAGQAFNRISEKLLHEGHDFLSLWFAEQAKRRFEGRESGRRAQAAQIRWLVKFLSHEHSKEEWEHLYQRLNDLEIYLSMSWDNVVEMARPLIQAPEQDLVEESLLWLGHGHLTLEDVPAALESFRLLAIVATSAKRRQEAEQGLSGILNKQIQTFYEQQAWVQLLLFHDEQQEVFHLIPLTRERVKAIAQAYRNVNLPTKAMQWYDQLLRSHPESPLREEIFAQKVFLAEEQGEGPLVRESGERYLQEYPEGQWQAEVSTALGMDSFAEKKYSEAIQELSDVVSRTHNQASQRYVLRQRALVYQEIGKRDLALLDLRQVVALDPLDMANVVRLGDFLFDQGDFSDSETLYEQVLTSSSSVALKAWAKYRWGLSLEYQGKAKEAEKLLGEIQQLDTRSPEFEHTIRAAAVAVLDEFSLNEKRQARRINEGG